MHNGSDPADRAQQIQRLVDAVPALEISTEDSILESHGMDWTRFSRPDPLAVAFPRSNEQVCELVSAAAAQGIALVPSGGRTGLSGGAVAAHGELVVSFDRMRQVLEFNATDRSLRVQAGVNTATVQATAEENGLYYPVSFASEGSSQIGGNIATNAGGIRVLRHGLTRERVSGLSVVTGTGQLLELNRGLVKNASGYDLRQLFIGSEGTLGLVVEATLQLVQPPPPGRVLLLGLDHLDHLMPVFDSFRGAVMLGAFEFFTERCLQEVMAQQSLPRPLDTSCPAYVLLEFECVTDAEEDKALACFERCIEAGWLLDGVISQSDAQAAELWRYRENISESISHHTPYKNDLSVRVSRVPELLGQLDALVAEECPAFEVLWYGHIGDGNLHMNILRPADMALDEFKQRCAGISEQSYALTQSLGGSISAEHGIGTLKQPWLGRVRSEEEIALMRSLKQVFDPAGIFNPGKLL